MCLCGCAQPSLSHLSGLLCVTPATGSVVYLRSQLSSQMVPPARSDAIKMASAVISGDERHYRGELVAHDRESVYETGRMKLNISCHVFAQSRRKVLFSMSET